MKFFEFSQNNSGGIFIVNEKVCHRIFIEAENKDEANKIAESLGCYWNGCENGIDCKCCGDRWSKVWDDEGLDLDKINENGYQVGVYDHYPNPEEHWYKRYGQYTVVQEPQWKEKMFRRYTGSIKFNNIEEYAQFLADEYGWTNPDVRIYYKNGKVKEIYGKCRQ